MAENPACTQCHQPCYPKGRDQTTGKCWTCRIPRPELKR